MKDLLGQDLARYARKGEMPGFQRYFRRYQTSKGKLGKLWWLLLFKLAAKWHHVELWQGAAIGEGLYIGHPYGITINPQAVLGRNCNIHKGVTIGQENRGPRQGAPVIGDRVWIGVNSTLVGNITIGEDVLIAPNSFVNRDVPAHSVVFGNPCVIKHRDNATEGYLQNTI